MELEMSGMPSYSHVAIFERHVPILPKGLNNDQLDIQLEPDRKPPNAHQRLPMLRNAHLRLSARTKIITLKKYLVQKLGLKDSSRNSVSSLF